MRGNAAHRGDRSLGGTVWFFCLRVYWPVGIDRDCLGPVGRQILLPCSHSDMMTVTTTRETTRWLSTDMMTVTGQMELAFC